MIPRTAALALLLALAWCAGCSKAHRWEDRETLRHLQKDGSKEGTKTAGTPTESEPRPSAFPAEKISAWIENLSSHKIEVYIPAIRRLGAAGDRAVPGLIKAMEDEQSRSNAALALAEVGSPAVAPLIGLLTHDQMPVRKLALTALRQITGEELGENAGAWKTWFEAQAPGKSEEKPSGS